MVREWATHTETRDSAASLCAGTSTAPAPASSHCMVRGNRNAITAPSTNNPALTSNVTCSPCTNASRAACRRAAPAVPPSCAATSYASPSECPAEEDADAGDPRHTRQPRRVGRVHHAAEQRDPDPRTELV